MPSLREELHEPLEAVRAESGALFSELAATAAFTKGSTGAEEEDRVQRHLDALAQLEKTLADKMLLIAQHQANQAKIAPLLVHVRERDERQRAAIARIAALRQDLRAQLAAADASRQEWENAQAAPLDYGDVLEYAQRLARYTSAPPGYRLQGDHVDGVGAGVQTSARPAPDYNQNPSRAAAYYDPAMPSIPQQLPFPSDMLMRQGRLYMDAAVDTAADAGAASGAAEGASGADARHVRAADTAAGTAEPTDTGAGPTALEAYAMDDDDAFDLDLNP
ncbi:hypothetical protein MSPP1_000059 [Malassezia sp. CBS 17886]|nr:hypothetical protein MSPP1_000059 [Malassezia sp. CBS 17886]